MGDDTAMSSLRAHVILLVGLVLVSTSGPFLRMARLDALAVVFFRMAAAGALFVLYGLLRGELRLSRAQLRRTALGALFLTAHFVLWIKAFDLTDYASNLLLLVAEPVMAAVAGIWLGERPTRHTWVSVVLAVAGLSVVAGGDFRLGPRALLGDAMCILGGAAITAFFVITRAERRALPLSAFMGVTLGVGALCTLPLALVARAPLWGYPAASWGWLGALVVLTTVGGHGAFNVAARHVSLFTVNVVVVLEPALAIAMGALLFEAQVTPLQILGGVVLAAAVVVGLRAPPGTRVEAAPQE